MKRPSWGKRGYSLQEIGKSLHDIYAAHQKAAATPNHPVHAAKDPDVEQAIESMKMRYRLDEVAASEKPTQGEVLKNRGGVPMSQAEFKKRLG